LQDYNNDCDFKVHTTLSTVKHSKSKGIKFMDANNLYIIRHVGTELNRLGIVQQRGVHTFLNEKGIQQAEAFFKFHPTVSFDNIYTSSQKRTHQFIKSVISVEHLKQFHQINWGKHKECQLSPQFKQEFSHCSKVGVQVY
jgi:hypothetical protein